MLPRGGFAAKISVRWRSYCCVRFDLQAEGDRLSARTFGRPLSLNGTRILYLFRYVMQSDGGVELLGATWVYQHQQAWCHPIFRRADGAHTNIEAEEVSQPNRDRGGMLSILSCIGSLSWHALSGRILSPQPSVGARDRSSLIHVQTETVNFS